MALADESALPPASAGGSSLAKAPEPASAGLLLRAGKARLKPAGAEDGLKTTS